MKKLLVKVGILVVFTAGFSCLFAQEINPKSQIKWGVGTHCGLAGYTWSPQANDCIQGSGGGAPPEGAPYEVNAKLDSTSFQGSGLFTSVDHKYLFTPASQWAQYAYNSPKSTYCGSKQCGDISIYSQDSPALNVSGSATGFGQIFYRYRKGLFTEQGLFNGYAGNPNQQAGGDVIAMTSDQVTFHTPSISQREDTVTICGKLYDCQDSYHYLHSHGGFHTGGDEGIKTVTFNAENSAARVFAANISGSPGVGATTLTMGTIYSEDEALVGGFVYNLTAGPNATCNVTNYDANNHLLTVTPGCVTPATATGTTTQVISVPTGTVNGTTVSVTTHVDTGTAFTNGLIVFGCNEPELEFVNATVTPIDGSGNQVITGTFLHGHTSGCKVGQGGTHGIGDLKADQQTKNGAVWKTSYWMWAAPDNSHIYERTFIQGGLGFINPWKHNFGNSITNAQVTGDGTNIKICNLGQFAYNFSGQYVRISGATPSTFNGTYTVGAIDANGCVSTASTATGTATGSTVQTGGDVNSPDGSILGTGGLYIWNAAVIRQLGTTATVVNGVTTTAYNGQITLFPNDVTFSNGNLMSGTDDMQNQTWPLTVGGVYDTAPSNSLNDWLRVAVSGNGLTTNKFILGDFVNGNSFSLYKGGGGTGLLDGITGLSVSGPFGATLDLEAPLQHGYGVLVSENPTIHANIGDNTYFPFVAAAQGGNIGWYVQYNPNTGISTIASGKGDGIVSAITMTPTDISLVASLTGTITLQGQTYKLNGLAGTGTRPVTADSTGTLGAAAGYSGSFTTADSKTCTVSNGLITGCS